MPSRFWVNKDYIHEITVLLAWFATFIPWNVQYFTTPFGEIVFIRTTLFQIRYQIGFSEAIQETASEPNPFILHVFDAYTYQAGNAMAEPYLFWLIAAVPFCLAFLLSITMYVVDSDRLSSVSLQHLESYSPLQLPRVMGSLLTLGLVPLSIASVKLYTTGFQGLNIPIGMLFTMLFAFVLLTNPVIDREEVPK